MQQESKLRPVIIWGNKLVCVDWQYFVETMREFFDAEEIDSDIIVRFQFMTDDEYESLEEFTGF